MFKSKTSMKILSLIVAVAIWLYVTGEVDPETRAKIANVPVNFVNAEMLADYGMAVASEDQEFVSVTVSGKRSDVNEVKRNGLTASVDVSSFEMGKNIGKITVNLPDGIKLENISESTMTVKVDELVYEYKPVEITFTGADTTGDTAAETVPWVMECYPEEISVSGAKSSVDKIVKLIGAVDAAEAVAGKEKQMNVDLLPVNKNGKEIKNVALYQDYAAASIRKLSVVSVELTAAASDKNIKIENLDIPEKVRIAGPEDAVSSIHEIKGTVTVEGEDISIDVDLPEDVFIMIGEDNGKIIWN